MTMTEVRVTILGGPKDGWSGAIRIPLEDEAKERIRLGGTVYRVRRANGQMLLVHPSATGLFWS